jgi:hypothetical protein
MWGLITLLLLLARLILVPPAYAHRPDRSSDLDITLIPGVHTSFAYYREPTSSSPLHSYHVAAVAGDFFHAGILVPQLDGLETYGANLLLNSPGLPEIDLEREHGSDADKHSLERSALSGPGAVGFALIEGSNSSHEGGK